MADSAIVVVSQTGPQGPRGVKGDPGTGIGVLGVFETVEALRAAHPTGSVGDVYAVGVVGVSASLYCWDPSSMDWSDIGQFTGPPGPVGPQGRQGDPGASGAKGDAGVPGVQGDPGPAGEQGATGSDGTQGPSGPDGPAGPIGPDGQKGDKGDRGEALNIKGYYASEADLISAHPTGQDGDAYLVGEGYLYVWQAVGNGWVNVGQLQGPKGDTGPQGATGPQGTPGTQGPQGAPGAKGGTGDTGPEGAKGIKGDTGAQGVQGAQGLRGATGPEGPQGPKGADGGGSRVTREITGNYATTAEDANTLLLDKAGSLVTLNTLPPVGAAIVVVGRVGTRFAGNGVPVTTENGRLEVSRDQGQVRAVRSAAGWSLSGDLATMVEAPVLTKARGGNGAVELTFKSPVMPPEEQIAAYRWRARRMDSGFVSEGIMDGNWCDGLGNGVPFLMSVAVVLDTGVVGAFSNEITATPQSPAAPTKPSLVQVEYVPTSWGSQWKLKLSIGRDLRDGSPIRVAYFRLLIESEGTVILDQTLNASGSYPLSILTQSYVIKTLGTATTLTLWAMNEFGTSQPDVISFDATQWDRMPIDYGIWEDHDGFRYHYVQDSISTWGKINPLGLNIEYGILSIGAGGSGSPRRNSDVVGNTVGGHGGSGAVGFKKGIPRVVGQITCVVGKGNAGYEAGGDTEVDFPGLFSPVLTPGGGSAVGKYNGLPDAFPVPQDIDAILRGQPYMVPSPSFRLLPCFAESTLVGGFEAWDFSTPPDGLLYGQGGGGTNGAPSTQGTGGPGLVVFRYWIKDIPAVPPALTVEQQAAWDAVLEREASEYVNAADIEYLPEGG
jgi:hypothetical protein